MNTENKIYTAADFAKYHQGNMSFAEMHALEKAALDDAFLADALEGYAATTNGENDLEILKKRLPVDKTNIKKIAFFAGINTRWMRIAAILILTLGISYFFYNKYDDKEISIAQNKFSTVDTLQIAEGNTDTLTPKAENQIETDKSVSASTQIKDAPKNKKETNPLNNNKEGLVSNPVSSSTIKDKAEERSDDKKNLTYNNSEANNVQSNAKFYTQQGNVTDMLGGPLQGVTIKEKTSKKGTLTDDNGNFKLKTMDSNAYVSIGSVGYAYKEVKLNNNRLQNISLDKKNSNLEEVVVVGYGRLSKRSETGAATTSIASKELSGKVAGVEIKNEKVIPSSVKNKIVTAIADTTLNNTQVFNEYVINNIIPLFDENNKPLKGKVALLFDVDKYGKPQNIQITYTSCAACNNQAINLLKNGPVWLDENLKRKNVVIEF